MSVPHVQWSAPIPMVPGCPWATVTTTTAIKCTLHALAELICVNQPSIQAQLLIASFNFHAFSMLQKGTKNALETGRTFATIFADMDFRQKLLDVHGEAEFKGILLKHAQDLASEQSNPTRRMGNHEPEAEFEVRVLCIDWSCPLY